MNWLDNLKSLMTLQDIPDERVLSLVPWAVQDAARQLGSDLASSLESADDPTWAAAVTHFIASRLILSSRTLVQGQAFPDSNSFGTQWAGGSERPSDLSKLLAMADHYKTTAIDICNTILASQTPSSEPRWYDI